MDRARALPGSASIANSIGDSMRFAIRFRHVATNGINLHLAEAGPQDGDPVLLLHGFPEFWYGWRHQIDALTEAGFRVLVPDQRGYNLSDRPQGITAYDLDILAGDILGLADALGLSTVKIVGHDWGGLVAWWIASRFSDRVARFAVLAAPHPAVWIDAMKHDWAQRKIGWYVKAFSLPWLPEKLLARNNFKALVDALRDNRRPQSLTEMDVEAYRQAWSQPGSLTGMVNWYRAILAKRLDLKSAELIKVPGLVIWGNGDRFGIKDLAARSLALCERASIVYLDTSHWVQHDAPDEVNALLLDFLES